MNLDINELIDIFTKRIAEKEKENILLQTYIKEIQKEKAKLKKEIIDLLKEKECE